MAINKKAWGFGGRGGGSEDPIPEHLELDINTTNGSRVVTIDVGYNKNIPADIRIEWGDGYIGRFSDFYFDDDYYSNVIKHTFPVNFVGTIKLYSDFGNFLFGNEYPNNNITAIRGRLPKSPINDVSYSFTQCYRITSVGPGLLDYNTDMLTLYSLLGGCGQLRDYPPTLFRRLTKLRAAANNFASSGVDTVHENLWSAVTTPGLVLMNNFSSCRNLTSIPYNYLPPISASPITLNGEFMHCTSITSAVPDWWTLPGSRVADGHGCFFQCTNAANYGSIPAYWKENYGRSAAAPLIAQPEKPKQSVWDRIGVFPRDF